MVPGAATRGAGVIGARGLRSRGVSPMKVFVLLAPDLGAGSLSLRHHQEVALARVVNLPGLDQGPQGLVDQVDEVLGDGDL